MDTITRDSPHNVHIGTTIAEAFGSDFGIDFFPYCLPERGHVGYRAVRDGVIELIYATTPAPSPDPDGLGRVKAAIFVHDSDVAPDDEPTATATLDLVGPVTATPWTNGRDHGWRIVTSGGMVAHLVLVPSVGGGTPDVFVYQLDEDPAVHVDAMFWLPIHERTEPPAEDAFAPLREWSAANGVATAAPAGPFAHLAPAARDAVLTRVHALWASLDEEDGGGSNADFVANLSNLFAASGIA
jgi:hypothetical protein